MLYANRFRFLCMFVFLSCHVTVPDKDYWYPSLNKACRKFDVGKAYRDSVPRDTKINQIEKFVEQLLAGSEERREMKLVVLGNGRIGKTTLLCTIKKLLHKVCYLLPVKHTLIW